MENKKIEDLGIMEKPEKVKIKNFWIKRFKENGNYSIDLEYLNKNKETLTLSLRDDNLKIIKKQYPELKGVIRSNLELTKKKIMKKYMKQNKEVVSYATNSNNGLIPHGVTLAVLSVLMIAGIPSIKPIIALIMALSIPLFSVELIFVIKDMKKNKKLKQNMLENTRKRELMKSILDLVASISRGMKPIVSSKIEKMYDIDINDLKMENASMFYVDDLVFIKGYLEKLSKQGELKGENLYKNSFNDELNVNYVSNCGNCIKTTTENSSFNTDKEKNKYSYSFDKNKTVEKEDVFTYSPYQRIKKNTK